MPVKTLPLERKKYITTRDSARVRAHTVEHKSRLTLPDLSAYHFRKLFKSYLHFLFADNI
jgi:hypothetical protein